MRKVKNNIKKLLSILLIMIVVFQQISPIIADGVYAKAANNLNSEESVTNNVQQEEAQDLIKDQPQEEIDQEEIQDLIKDQQQEITEKEGVNFESRPPGEVEENLITRLELIITDNSENEIKIENGQEYDLDVANLNAIKLNYVLERPDDFILIPGDTYIIELPEIYGENKVSGVPITINGGTVATYDISGGELTITFNEHVEDFDKVEMHVNISGPFNNGIFDDSNEVVVEVPYRDQASYSVTLRANPEEYVGEDKKTAGKPYILSDDGEKLEVDRNPTHIDWKVRVNDNMETFTNATIIDDLGAYLELVEDSFIVERIIRNYKNDEIARETVKVFDIEYTDGGFEIKLGNINDAYDISYTTKVNRPEGGGTYEINNSARIILDDDKNDVEDVFTGTWSGDIPVIDKSGNSTDNPHIIEWQVEYNYGKESLGQVSLTDDLSNGEVILETIKVYQVDTDIDGDVIGERQKITVTPTLEGSKFTIPNLDADGKAYLITFSSLVPVGLNEKVVNKISDDLPQPNSDEASVDVNTIPTGNKIGKQYIDGEGSPYIEWTITMNTENVDVPSIEVIDVFDPEMLEFKVDDKGLYTLYKDGDVEDNFTIQAYPEDGKTDDKGRSGFRLNITNAGPHKYEFVYKTYYTEKGMGESELANHAELIFEDGDGKGIGEAKVVDYSLEGPKAGIDKSGRYISIDDDTAQQIEWKITINESRILLNKPKVTDKLTSNNKDNFSYIEGSLVIKEFDTNNKEVGELTQDTDYTFTIDGDGKGFVILFNKETKAKYEITYKTSVDDKTNSDHTNEASLTWLSNTETAIAKVGKRNSGINKTGNVKINEDGTKTVYWTIDFNINENIILDFNLTDTYTPASVTVKDIKITSNGTDVTEQFEISKPENGEFTVEIGKLNAVPYQLTYSTTLSPEEEQQKISNTANITYTGGNDEAIRTIPRPSLGVEKEANGINKEVEKPVISWTIQANTDSANHYINLVDAVLDDTIPMDQKLLEDSLKVYRTDDNLEEEITSLNITTGDNSFSIELPDGPYQYTIKFDTEILEYPSFHETELDRYTNSTVLKNQTKTEDDTLKSSAKADAYIDYFDDGSNNNNLKTGKVNDDTENIYWEATVNPLGLTINKATIIDTLSKNQYYVIDDEHQIEVKTGEVILTEGEYTLEMFDETDKNYPGFKITFNNDNGQITKPITISYSTRLNPKLIGTYTVSNNIILRGGEEDKKLSDETKSSENTQWTYGGGGSGQTLGFTLRKESPNKRPLQGAIFDFTRITVSGTEVPIGGTNIETGENGEFEIEYARAGRYIVKETKAPEGYKKLEEPIYMIIGYADPDKIGPGDSEYIIKITDSDWEEIESDVAKGEGDRFTVVNQYTPVSQGFQVSKSLEGQDLKAEQFEFELLDSSNNVVDKVFNDAEGNITFEKQYFNEPGTYTFKIREVEGQLGGINYDPDLINVVVGIQEGDKGLEVQTLKYFGKTKFVNTYTPAPANAVIKASKILEGQDLREGQFEFQLLDSNRQLVTTATNKEDGSIVFEEISHDKVGQYDYYIREATGQLGGITYDKAELEVSVFITDDGKGQLHAEVRYTQGPLQFTNQYEPGPGSIVLKAEKILRGKILEKDQFEFELLDSEGKVLQTAKNNANGQVIFEEIEFDNEGVYNFQICEVDGHLGGITYDQTVYPVTVTVVDGGEGYLVARAVYDNGPAVFTNVYKAGPGSIVLEVKKILEGQELRKDQFTFTLTDGSSEIIQTVTNNAEGQIIFDEISYDSIGIYPYIISEVKGIQGGMTYDQREHFVIVEVKDNFEGELVAEANYISGPVVFGNTYTPEPDSVVIEASKILKGQKLRKGQFIFELLDEEGNVLQTKENNSNGQIIFDEITYEVGGTYEYTIREVEGQQGGVTYDTVKHKVKVRVIDDGIGTLTAEMMYDDGPAIFTNTYEPGPDSVVFEGSKVLQGQDLRQDQFTFELLDGEGQVLETVTNNGQGQIIFSEIIYEEVGEYSYIIREVAGSQDGIIYDDTIFELVVIVTDNDEGLLVASVEYVDGPVEFINVYEENKDISPKTGDDSVILRYSLIAIISLSILIVTIYKLRKEKHFKQN